ncbi:MAG: hypothetical protein VW405_06850, partial [Rhodospirillaceae bacterium]
AEVAALRGAPGAAGTAIDACLAIHPREPRAGMQRAALALSSGDLAAGWRQMESRFRYWRRDTPAQTFAQPRWQGEDPAGRSLMVWREEGVGDEMRFASCVPELAERGFSRVIFECAPRLAELFGRSFPGIEVRAEAPKAPADYDLQIPLFSLPGFLRPDLEAFPDRLAYLRADPDRAAGWRSRLAAFGDGARIGVCWRSLNTSWAKMPFHSDLADWAPVLALPGVTWVSLQVGASADELDRARAAFGVDIHVLDGLDLRDDFDGVAAVVSQLDAVVSARCWVPILAGALGVPTHCFGAAFNPYFQGQDRDPWMPAVSVHVGDKRDGWREPMTAIAADLAARVGRLR